MSRSSLLLCCFCHSHVLFVLHAILVLLIQCFSRVILTLFASFSSLSCRSLSFRVVLIFLLLKFFFSLFLSFSSFLCVVVLVSRYSRFIRLRPHFILVLLLLLVLVLFCCCHSRVVLLLFWLSLCPSHSCHPSRPTSSSRHSRPFHPLFPTCFSCSFSSLSCRFLVVRRYRFVLVICFSCCFLVLLSFSSSASYWFCVTLVPFSQFSRHSHHSHSLSLFSHHFCLPVILFLIWLILRYSCVVFVILVSFSTFSPSSCCWFWVSLVSFPRVLRRSHSCTFSPTLFYYLSVVFVIPVSFSLNLVL